MFKIGINEEEMDLIHTAFGCRRFKILVGSLSNHVVKENGYGATGNTLRGFHLDKTKQKKRVKTNRECFDEWAIDQIESGDYIKEPICKKALRKWKYKQAKKLQNAFTKNYVKNAKEPKDIFRFVKLIDLFIKNRIFAELCADKKRSLIAVFDVPLDKYSLIQVRQSYNSSVKELARSEYPLMPKTVSMGWVKNKKQYELVQGIINEISRDSSFEYDVFTWNFCHLTGIENALIDALIERQA